MAAETSCSLKHLKLNKCFIHFEDVSQSLLKVTEKQLKRFVACHERWTKLKGEKSVAICTTCSTNEDGPFHLLSHSIYCPPPPPPPPRWMNFPEQLSLSTSLDLAGRENLQISEGGFVSTL
jgi:hypothetical protein